MKQKTKKAAIKRFKITSKGKIIRTRQMAGHLKKAKSKSAKTRYKKIAFVDKADIKRIRKLISYAS